MSPQQKVNAIKRILKHKEAIKTHDEAIVGLLDQLPQREAIKVSGKTYVVREIFEGGSATWRPARVHKLHLEIIG